MTPARIAVAGTEASPVCEVPCNDATLEESGNEEQRKADILDGASGSANDQADGKIRSCFRLGRA